MKSGSWKFGRTLASRIIIPLFLTILALGVCLYYFNLRLLSDFAADQIDQSLSASSHEVYDICNRNFTQLLQSGRIIDEGSVRIAKARTIKEIENYMRENSLGGRIVSKDGSELFSHKLSPAHPSLGPHGNMKPKNVLWVPGNHKYYETYMTFTPWSWEIAIDMDASAFADLRTTVRNVYLFTVLILVFTAALLFYFLDRSVKTPVRKIINDVRAGLRPQYEGIEEFSFLSANIGQMMTALQESEQTIRDIATGLGEGVYVVDGAGGLVFMNQEAERLLGWTQDELLGRTAHDVFHRHTERVDGCPMLDLTNAGETYRTEEDTFLRKDGSAFHVAYVAAPLKKEGAARGAITVFRDITERRRMENRLNEQLHFFQQLLDSIPIPVYYKDRDGLYLGCNAALEEFMGVKKEDMVGKTSHDLIPKERADIHREADLKLLSQPTVQTYEVGGIFTDGKYHDVVLKKATFLDSSGRVAGIVGANVDITEIKQAERERLASLKFFESMDKVNRAIQSADDPEKMMKDLLDVVLSIFDCDRAFLMYPCDPDAQTWSVPVESNRPEYAGVLEENLKMEMDPQVAGTARILLATEGPVIFGPGGKYEPCGDVSQQFGIKSFMSMAIYPKTGSPWEFGLHQCAYPREWTSEEKQLFEAIGRRLADGLSMLLSFRDLRKNEEFLDKIVEHIPNTIFVKDAQTLKYVRFNSAGERLLEYSREELLGKTDQDLFPGEIADSISAVDRRVLDSGKPVDIPEEIILNRSKETRFLRTQKIPILDENETVQYLLGISEDITERKKLEGQLRQAQKMEAVGRLAGGVAHDFNNMLSVILGYSELIIARLQPFDPILAPLKAVQSAANRSADLTRQLLAFSRKQTIAPRVIDLNEQTKTMERLLTRIIGEDIDLAFIVSPGLWRVYMDPAQIDQILANLAVNSRDAMPHGGKLTIETCNVTLDKEYSETHLGFTPGEFVMLAVSDTGCGMDRETLEHAFEPFFTTKPEGKGTGLGLATVYGIVKQNDGFVNIYSEPDRGTTVKIYIRRYRGNGEAVRAPVVEKPSPGGWKTILLVEDEGEIRQMVKTMLEGLGYTVLEAQGPGDAVLICEEHPAEIHLLFTDVVMPNMNGKELETKIRAIRPGIRTLFMSGYTANAIAHLGVLDKGVKLLQKPFTLNALAGKVREVLSESS